MIIKAHFLYEQQAIDYLKSQLVPSIQITTGDDIPSDTTHIIGGRPTREQLTACPDLQAIIIPFTGIPEQTRLLMADFPQVAVHNSHHNAPMTAEMAITLLMAVAKRISDIERTFRQHDWTERYDGERSVILDGKMALILGYGAIGQRVGAVCKALGMNVLGVRRSRGIDEANGIYPQSKLHELLPRTDVLMICLPGTPDTTGMIGKEELSLMPEGGILVNIGRGAIVDQEALYHALRDRHLYGAGSDVWYNYPADEVSRKNTPPADFPFNELDNMVMSPHRAGGFGSVEAEQRRMRMIAEKLNAAANGQPIPDRLNLNDGY